MQVWLEWAYKSQKQLHWHVRGTNKLEKKTYLQKNISEEKWMCTWNYIGQSVNTHKAVHMQERLQEQALANCDGQWDDSQAGGKWHDKLFLQTKQCETWTFFFYCSKSRLALNTWINLKRSQDISMEHKHM